MNVKSCLVPDGNARLTGVRIAQQSSYVMTVSKKACHILYLQCYQSDTCQMDDQAGWHCTGCNSDDHSERNCLTCRTGVHSHMFSDAETRPAELVICAF